MELQQARTLSQEVVSLLSPHCQRIEVVGSIRRKTPFPRDIDLVLIPGNQGALAMALHNLGTHISTGEKIARRLYKGIGVDVYIATPETWACHLLIRTGSKEHNIKLTGLAKRRGWQLHADGRGLFNGREDSNEKRVRLAGDTEESFFVALQIPYLLPEMR